MLEATAEILEPFVEANLVRKVCGSRGDFNLELSRKTVRVFADAHPHGSPRSTESLAKPV